MNLTLKMCGGFGALISLVSRQQIVPGGTRAFRCTRQGSLKTAAQMDKVVKKMQGTTVFISQGMEYKSKEHGTIK